MKKAGLLVVLIGLSGAGVSRAAVAPPLVPPGRRCLEGDLAQLLLGKCYVLAPQIQRSATASRLWVDGPGAFRLECGLVLEGQKGPLTVHWTRGLNVTGPVVEVVGGIQAEQGSARLVCRTLHVAFAQPLSLHEGQANSEPATVQDLIGSDFLLQHFEYKNDRAVRYQRAQGKEGHLQLDEGSSLLLAGPGSYRQAKAEGARFHLTDLSFSGRLDRRKDTLRAWGNCHLVEMPAKDPAQKIDLAQMLTETLPEGVFYLRADCMRVRGGQVEADGRVYVQGRTFYARADRVKFDRSKGRLILDGRASGEASLYQSVPGHPYDVITGETIHYNVNVGQVIIDRPAIKGVSRP
jgi:hypothetical protein